MVVNIFGLGEIQAGGIPALQKQVQTLHNMVTQSAPTELKESINTLHNQMVNIERKYSEIIKYYKIIQESSIDTFRNELDERLENLEDKVNEQNEILTAYRNDLADFKRKIRGRIIFISNEKERINLQRIEASRERAINIANENMEKYIEENVTQNLNQLNEEINLIKEKLN